MTPKDIVDASSPAIVRIEAGSNKIGTGFVVDPAGLIATNLHVIAGESTIKVWLYKDQTEYQALSVAGVDKSHDLALVWIKPKKPLRTVRIGDSNAVSAGDSIVAIGNPLGIFDYTVSAGLISQVRPLSADLTILQISAPISPGSSGGPLFNQFGEVIGVTTAIISQGQNINLAVPGNYLRPLMAQKAQIALAEFATNTKDSDPEDGKAKGCDTDNVQITRKVPSLPVASIDGCSAQEIDDMVKAINDAISTGAPAYNRQANGGEQNECDPHGFQECFQIYEGTAVKFEHDAHCKVVSSAFGDGLLRAGAMDSFKEKAWAMRDTFDGLTCLAHKWCEKNQTKCSALVQKFAQCP